MSIINKSTIIGVAGALAVAATLSFAAADAAKKGPNAGTKGTAEAAAPVEAIALADQLAVYGIRNGDAIAIIQAAKMKKQNPGKDMADAKKSTDGKGVKADKTSGYDLSADALLTRAEGMAAGNATLAGLIKDARAAKSRGAIRGPTIHYDTVLAGNTDAYPIAFRGGEQAAVFVSGDGDTDLDLYVYDQELRPGLQPLQAGGELISIRRRVPTPLERGPDGRAFFSDSQPAPRATTRRADCPAS
jgi:hypothetical protein